MWKPGDSVALRGIYKDRVSYIQSAIVVHDRSEEVAVVLLPGAECSAPEDYINGKHGPSGHWDRWGEYAKGSWNMQRYIWHTNRLLILLQPEKYYACYYFWRAADEQFIGYYVNFQLPFRRSEIGFDSFDLELDIVIEPTYAWHWKDEDDYQTGIECGILRREWIREIDTAKSEIFDKLKKRAYPYDGTWLGWMPDPNWLPPTLPENWDKI